MFHFLQKTNDPHSGTFQGSRFSDDTRKAWYIIVTECYKVLNEGKTVYLDFRSTEVRVVFTQNIYTSSSSDYEKKHIHLRLTLLSDRVELACFHDQNWYQE